MVVGMIGAAEAGVDVRGVGAAVAAGAAPPVAGVTVASVPPLPLLPFPPCGGVACGVGVA